MPEHASDATPTDATIPLQPAATVVLLRDSPAGIETLLLRRNRRLAFGGHWVFPGGRIDPSDVLGPPGAATRDLATVREEDLPGLIEDPVLARAARRAAVREVREETGLVLDTAELVWCSHWTPPPGRVRRFATWFFLAGAPQGAVTVDGGEILAHAWMRPADAHARRDAGEIELSPPTWVTLWQLRAHGSVGEALAGLAAHPPLRFATHWVPAGIHGDHDVALWHGDAGYDAGDPRRAGGRHRLEMHHGGWRYLQHPAPTAAGSAGR